MRHQNVPSNELTPEQALDCLQDAFNEVDDDAEIPDALENLFFAVLDVLRTHDRYQSEWSDDDRYRQ